MDVKTVMKAKSRSKSRSKANRISRIFRMEDQERIRARANHDFKDLRISLILRAEL